MLKFYTGKIIGTIGARLWKIGGWTGDERCEDLKVTGKIGYHMFVKGLKLMNITPEKIGTCLKNR